MYNKSQNNRSDDSEYLTFYYTFNESIFINKTFMMSIVEVPLVRFICSYDQRKISR